MTTFAEGDSFERIANAHARHSRTELWWNSEDAKLAESRTAMMDDLETRGGLDVGPLGFVPFGFVEMGAINSLDLFGLDELILFSFYWRNRERYRHAVDMGANIGLHSILLARMGYSVTSYEPDPLHMRFLVEHVEANGVGGRVQLHQSAVAKEAGKLDFIRVLGNTTGSHVAGAKRDPYGELEAFNVDAVAFRDVLTGADLIKMDVEGLEAELLCAVEPDVFMSTDLVCEVGSVENAVRIWDHFKGSEIGLFSQKVNWSPASSANDLPTTHREGSLFVSARSEMPWAQP